LKGYKNISINEIELGDEFQMSNGKSWILASGLTIDAIKYNSKFYAKYYRFRRRLKKLKIG